MYSIYVYYNVLVKPSNLGTTQTKSHLNMLTTTRHSYMLFIY